MIGLLGKKVGMTKIFTEDGRSIPVTVISAGPCKVLQVKTEKHDGYQAVQLGYDLAKPRKATKPMMGHFKKSGAPPFKRIKEFTIDESEMEFRVGQEIAITDVFHEGELVDCTGTSKGKGFQGVVKRYGFKGGPKSHGQSDRHRAPGSIGASSSPSRVIKGIKMPGRMGNKKVTVKGLRIIRMLENDNLILVKGSIAGPKGGYILIKRSKKGR